jgi:hypothetical protein
MRARRTRGSARRCRLLGHFCRLCLGESGDADEGTGDVVTVISAFTLFDLIVSMLHDGDNMMVSGFINRYFYL